MANDYSKSPVTFQLNAAQIKQLQIEIDKFAQDGHYGAAYQYLYDHVPKQSYILDDYHQQIPAYTSEANGLREWLKVAISTNSHSGDAIDTLLRQATKEVMNQRGIGDQYSNDKYNEFSNQMAINLFNQITKEGNVSREGIIHADAENFQKFGPNGEIQKGDWPGAIIDGPALGGDVIPTSSDLNWSRIYDLVHSSVGGLLDKQNKDLGDWILPKLLNMGDSLSNLFDNLLPDWASPWSRFNRKGTANFQVVWGKDPITLDLDGDGIETFGHNGTGGVMFDHTGEGIKNPTGWVSSDDGFLVLDRNNDGLINNGTELFGDSTVLTNGDKAEHGFAALADLDSNQDGVIDVLDDQFSQLKVWRDLNGDGISQAGELFTLDQLGIASLNLKYSNTSVGLPGNNILAQIGSYTKTDGSTGQMGDLYLDFDPLKNGFTDSITLTPEQEKAANMTGMGRLRDLREAAALSEDLAQKLEAYSNAQTKAEQLALLPDLIEAWAKTDTKFNFDYDKLIFDVATHDPNSSTEANSNGNGNSNDWVVIPKELRERWKDLSFFVPILDSFTNMTTERLAYISPTEAELICNTIEKMFAELLQASYKTLLLQTRLKPYIDATSITIKDGALSLDFAPILAKFDQVFAANPKKAFVDLGEFLVSQDKGTQWIDGMSAFGRYMVFAQNQGVYDSWLNELGADVVRHLSLISGTTGNDVLTGTKSNDLLFGGIGNDVLNGESGDDFIDGQEGDDTLYGGAGKDTLLGGDGDDILYGQNDNDRLIGSAGNDTLYGGYGDDTYVFAKGHGQDVIIEDGWASYFNYDTAFDTIEFTDLLSHPILNKIEGNDLVLYGYYGGDESITIKNYFSSHKVEQIRLADGSIINISQYLKEGINFLGTDEDDTLTGLAGRDVMYGGLGNDTIKGEGGDDFIDGQEGDDTLYGAAGKDTLIGGAGDDILYGENDNDHLIGGTGNDTLYGGYGDDTYVFAKGHGQDTIIEDNWASYYNHDTAFDTIEFTDALDHTILARKEGNDLILYGYYENGESIIIKNHFSDSSRTIEQIRFSDGSILSLNDVLKNGINVLGSDADDSMTGSASRDLMYGGLGNDTLNGGAGHDELYGQAGNDTLYGDGGDDLLDGGEGNDMLYGGVGNDTLIGGTGDDILYGENDNDRLIGGSGNDTLYGGYGDDTYVFAKGHGHDIIIEDAWGNYYDRDTAFDTIEFTDTLDHAISLRKDGNDLVLYGYYNNGESITIKNHFSSSHTAEQIRFADGSIITMAQLIKNGITMLGTDADDTITGGAGNDILEGGKGNDTLTGGEGDDTYVFSNGDGQDLVHNYYGKDTLLFKDLKFSEARFMQSGYHLIIYGLGNDRITLNNFFASSNSTYYQAFQFADRTLTRDELWQNGLPLSGDNQDRSITGWGISQQVYGGSGNETITTGSGNDIIYGGAGNDTIKAGAGNDLLYGGDGNDTLEGGDGDDLLTGGAGNDTLNGGAGDDIYVFNQGDGQDVMYDSQGNNTLVFKDLNFADARFIRSGYHLIVYGAEGDQVTINNFFYDEKWKIQNYQFKDQSFTLAEFKQIGLTLSGNGSSTTGWDGVNIIYGSSADETITTYGSNDTIYGGAGNDTLRAGAGNDFLDGGEGNDTLEGGDGNDILIGGKGNDNLNGGAGDDTYIFNQGDGQDVMGDSQGNNTIIFNDLNYADARFMRSGNHLIVYGAEGDQVTINNFFYDEKWKIQNYQFKDQTITLEEFRQNGLPLSGDGQDRSLAGWGTSQHVYGGSGNETITTSSGNDYLSGGAGNDTLNGGAGNDTYLFGSNHGKDTITDSSGNDTIAFTGNQQANDLWFSRQGNNLLIETLGTDDSITVNSWFSNANYQIETIQLNSGQALINQQVQSLISAMASFAPDAGSSIDVATQKQDYLAQIGISSYWDK